MELTQIAQSALADAFDAIEKVGGSGRDKCKERYGVTLMQTPERGELSAMLDFAESCIILARGHLSYMPATAYRIGQSVVFARSDGAAATGSYQGVTRGGRAVVKLDDPNGASVDVPFEELRPCAPLQTVGA